MLVARTAGLTAEARRARRRPRFVAPSAHVLLENVWNASEILPFSSLSRRSLSLLEARRRALCASAVNPLPKRAKDVFPQVASARLPKKTRREIKKTLTRKKMTHTLD